MDAHGMKNVRTNPTNRDLMGTTSQGDIVLDDLKRPQNGIWVQGSDDGQTRVDFSLLLPFTHFLEPQKGWVTLLLLGQLSS